MLSKELAERDSAMDDFQDILSERRRTSDILWAARNWEPACAYAQTKKPNPNDIKTKTLVGAPLKNTLKTLSMTRNMSMETLNETAKAMVEEIAFQRATSVLRFLAWITSKLTKSLLFGVMVNGNKFLMIKSQFGKNPVVLVPNHRSYGDFILMSFICFHYDVDIPRIAAGTGVVRQLIRPGSIVMQKEGNCRAMSFTSSVLRKACAFFMRRSFNTDKLYSAVFEQYVNTLITNGDASIEFFIEGTRSRTAKSYTPKYGFLKMVLKSYFTAMVPDVTVLPVSFSYDRVMEERLFAFELLGIPKPQESTKGLFKAYTTLFNEKLGYVNVNFGDPISVKEFFGQGVDRSIHNFGPVEMQELTSDESKQTARLAHAIVRQQQRLTMITCFNLVATIINHHVSESCVPLSLEELVSGVEWLSPIMTALGAVVTVKGDLTNCILEYIKLHKSFVTVTRDGKIKLLLDAKAKYDGDNVKIRGHRLSDRTMSVAVPLLMLQFYSNPCSPFLVNLCFVALIVESDKTGTLSVDELFSQFQFLRSVFSSEFVLGPETEEQDFAAAFEFAKNQKMVVQTESEVKAGENTKLGQFCVSYIKLYISSYLIIIDVLFKESGNLVTNQIAYKSYQKAVEPLIMEDILIHPASLSLNLVDNAIKAFFDMDVMKRIRRKELWLYEVRCDLLENVKTRLGKYDAVTKLNGKISQHLGNFLYCKY